MIRASTVDELALLLDMCRTGKLFDVQDWIRQERPIALPEDAPRKYAHRNPLWAAIDSGFNSLVQVFLEAGAPVREHNYRALDHAVDLRRPDLVRLLFQHGATVDDVRMQFVLEMWESQVVELFLEQGASLERDKPVAWALIGNMRPVLGLLKRFGPTNPNIMAQAGMALRYHANEGNVKWTALLLWAGADPHERGPYRPEDFDAEPDPDEEDPSAVELAVASGKIEILKLPAMRKACRPNGQATEGLLERACYHDNAKLLSVLFELGHRPEVLPDRGTRAINRLLCSMSFCMPTLYSPFGHAQAIGVDTERAMECMKAVHMLVARGAKWLPDKDGIRRVRTSLVKMKPGYFLEFVWLLGTYRAARKSDVLELFRTPSIRQVLGDKRAAADQIIDSLPAEPAAQC